MRVLRALFLHTMRLTKSPGLPPSAPRTVRRHARYAVLSARSLQAVGDDARRPTNASAPLEYAATRAHPPRYPPRRCFHIPRCPSYDRRSHPSQRLTRPSVPRPLSPPSFVPRATSAALHARNLDTRGCASRFRGAPHSTAPVTPIPCPCDRRLTRAASCSSSAVRPSLRALPFGDDDRLRGADDARHGDRTGRARAADGPSQTAWPHAGPSACYTTGAFPTLRTLPSLTLPLLSSSARHVFCRIGATGRAGVHMRRRQERRAGRRISISRAGGVS